MVEFRGEIQGASTLKQVKFLFSYGIFLLVVGAPFWWLTAVVVMGKGVFVDVIFMVFVTIYVLPRRHWQNL